MTEKRSLLSTVAETFAREVHLTPGSGLRSLQGQWVVHPGSPTFTSKLMVWKHEHLVITRALGDAARLERDEEQIRDELSGFVDITILVSGSLKCFQRDREIIVTAGLVLALACDEPYIAHSTDGTESFTYYVSRAFLASRGVDSRSLAAVSWELPPVSKALHYMSLWALDANANSIAHDKGAIERALLELVLDVVAGFNKGFVLGNATAAQGRDQALATIEARYRDPGFDAEVLAAEINLSKRQLYRLFEGRDMTIAKFIRSKRLDHAELLMRTSPHLTVQEIGTLSGFASATQFSRAFKERHGCPPSGTRKGYSD